MVYKKIMAYEDRLKRGESAAIIQLQYNYSCNLRCQHCSVDIFRNQNGHRRIITVKDVKNLFDEAHEMGLAQAGVTGGEPITWPDLDEVIQAIDPSRFHIQVDTNGWAMTPEILKHWKEIGVDKVLLSIDSLSAKEHDSFRGRIGSHKRAIKAIDWIKEANLAMFVSTIVTPQRLRSQEFIDFLELMKRKDVVTFKVWPHPAGKWEGRQDLLPTDEDIEYARKLAEKYSLIDDLTSSYGVHKGCVAVKHLFSITRYGDVMPCPWMFFKLGNIFEEPLKDIVSKGMKYFGGYSPKCHVSEDREFIDKYVSKTWGQKVPVAIEQIFNKEV